MTDAWAPAPWVPLASIGGDEALATTVGDGSSDTDANVLPSVQFEAPPTRSASTAQSAKVTRVGQWRTLCQRDAEPGRYEQARKPAACREAKQGISFDASGRFAIAHRSLLRGRSWYYVTSARAGCRQRETFGLCCTPALSPLHSLIRPVKRLCLPLAIHDVIDACRRNTERLRQREP